MNFHHHSIRQARYWLASILCGINFIASGVQNSVVVWGGSNLTNVPVDVTNVASLATGNGFCLAVLRDGRLRKWGSSTNIPLSATNVVAAGASGSWGALRRDGTVIDGTGVVWASNGVAIAVAYSYGAAALTRDGVFKSWGTSGGGPQNNTSNVAAIVPGGYAAFRALITDGTVSPSHPNLPTISNVVAIADNSTFSSHLVCLRNDGTVVAASFAANGLTNVPSGLSNVVAVASGSAHGLALKKDGTVVAWGSNTSGQTNVPVGLSNVVAIAAGDSHSLALKADGRVVAWGRNSNGQTNVPPNLTHAAAIFAGPDYSAAIVGDSPPTLLSQPPDETVWVGRPVTLTVKAIGSGPLHQQWQFNGENIEGATNSWYRIDQAAFSHSGVYNFIVSNSRGTAASREAIVTVQDNPSFILQPTNQTVLLGEDVTFRTSAIGSQTVSYQWFFEGGLIFGATNSTLTLTNLSIGQTGNYWVTASNALGIRTSAVVTLSPRTIWASPSIRGEIPSDLISVTAIATGGGNYIAVKSNGTVVLWGEDDYVSWWPLTGISNVVAVAAGYQFYIALLADGTVVGRALNNSQGQINAPLGLSNVVSVSAGASHSLALRVDGSVVAWGGNSYGQTNVPTGLTNVVGISAGYYHSLALREDGSIVAWGYNQYGQTNIPPGLTNVVAVAGGGHHSLALCADGKVVAWGYNTYGQTNVPSGLSNVVAIAAGFYHSLALGADGTVTPWGQASVPSNLRNVVAIAAGNVNSLALRAEGLLAPPVTTLNAVCSGTVFSLQTFTTRGKSYYLQYRDSFGGAQWMMRPPVPGDGDLRTLVDPSASVPQRFYRVWQKP